MANKISIRDIEEAIRQSMSGSEIQFSDSVYEKKGGQMRLIIFFNKLFTTNNVVLYTKLLFEVDDSKQFLETNNSGQNFFKYLYDINCQYRMKVIDDANDFKNQWMKIIKENDFGQNIKILSEFIKQPSFLVNEWFNKNGIKDISLTGFKYEPRAKVMPCKILSFHFVLNVNNSEEVELFIKKEDKNDFIYTFNINGENINVNKSDLTTLVQTVSETLKDNYSVKESTIFLNENKKSNFVGTILKFTWHYEETEYFKIIGDPHFRNYRLQDRFFIDIPITNYYDQDFSNPLDPYGEENWGDVVKKEDAIEVKMRYNNKKLYNKLIFVLYDKPNKGEKEIDGPFDFEKVQKIHFIVCKDGSCDYCVPDKNFVKEILEILNVDRKKWKII